MNDDTERDRNAAIAGLSGCPGSAIWPALACGALMAVGVVALWYSINERAHQHIELAAENAARIDQVLIEESIENRLVALNRLARQIRPPVPSSDSGPENGNARFVAHLPGFRAIYWTDVDAHVGSSVISGTDQPVADNDGMPMAGAGAAVRKAIASGHSGFGHPFDLGEGRIGIAVNEPVTSDERLSGTVTGILDLTDLLQDAIGPVQTVDYQTRILLNERQAYRYDPDTGSPDTSHLDRRDFRTGGLAWTVLVTPTSGLLSAGHAESSTLVLIVGLLLSLLLALAVYLAVVSRSRSRQLHDAAIQLDTLFQNLPGIAYRRDSGSGWPMRFVSAGCRSLTGYTRAEFENQDVAWNQLIQPDDRERVMRAIERAIDKMEPYELEYRVHTRTGVERWMWERGRPVDSLFGNTLELEGFISDISDRKATELALSEARAFSDAIVETAADAIIIVDADGNVEKLNRAAQQMFGYGPDEFTGQKVTTLIPGGFPGRRGSLSGEIAGRSGTGPAQHGRERTARRKDGSSFPIYLSVSAVESHARRLYVGLVRDLSEQRAAENEARQYREELAHVDRLNMLGEMATGIAHEINQPLTAISLFTRAGGRFLESGNNERLPEIFEKLNRHAHRAGEVIERMQDLARRRSSNRSVTDCNRMILEVAKLAETEARIRDMTIDIVTEPELPPVSVDVVQIQQVALNLLRNGMEAMEVIDCRDGNSIVIRTRRVASEEIEVSVRDSGCGIAEDVADALFTPFSTTKKSGMGMGLSISRSIIIAHGGQLNYVNNAGGGATFFFTLPIANQESIDEG